jgi:hypothetical protein
MAYKSPDKIVYDSATGATFKEAFADARKEGQKTFEWNGKKYGTKLKGEDEPKQGKVKEDATIESGKRQKSAPKDEKEDKRSRGTAAALASAGVGLGAMALLGGMRKSERDRKDREMSKGKEGRSMKSPVRNISPEEAAFENEGGRYYKKGGNVRKFAAGGTTTVKPEPKKAPMPDFARDAKENRMRDQRVKKEQEAYDKYDKNRLKDQGGFKKGGVTRGDGIATRGKTKGRMI